MTAGNALANSMGEAIQIDIDKREKKSPYALEFPAGFTFKAAKLEFKIDSPPEVCSVPKAKSAYESRPEVGRARRCFWI